MADRTKLIGEHFNDWEVLEVLPNRKLKCRCSCGVVKEVAEYSVISGKSKNCGHTRRGEDITGKQFGNLIVMGKSPNSCMWYCKCSCGKVIEATKYELNSGRNKCSSKCQGSFIGQVFEELTVESFDISTNKWVCRCTCGNTRLASMKDLKSGSIKRCESCRQSARFKDTQGKIEEIIEPRYKIDLTGKIFGELTVIKYNNNTGKWVCTCSCGNTKEVRGSDLTRHMVTTCGHNRNKPKINLVGKQFNELAVIEYTSKGKWKCQCSCGNITYATTTELQKGYKKTCGHLKQIDITGQQFGELTVLGRDTEKHGFWKCKCSCGKEISLRSGWLKSNGYKSCGHIKENRFINLLGQQFGDLTVIEYLGYQNWLCKCSCGNEVEVLGHNLRSGHTKSCGCKTLKFYNTTMIDRYGDTASKRIGTPREDWQIEIINNKGLFEQYIEKYEEDTGRLPSANELALKLNLTPQAIRLRAEQHGVIIRNTVSSAEDEINDIYSGFEQHCRGIIPKFELDLYNAEKKIAIEYNGDYWHSTVFKSKNYHQEKTLACAKQGIRLIHIFEYEWLNPIKRDKILNILDSSLDVDEPIVIYGRDTDIRAVAKEDSDVFLTDYHLQGTSSDSIRIGCYFNNELIGIMTFGKPRFGNAYEYEIIRMAWKPGYVVIGGLEKIFKTFIKQYNPKNIFTYVDISKFTGNSYLRLGFRTDINSITEPGYTWVNKRTHEHKSRYQTQKQKLVREYPDMSNMTEDEIMTNLGYLKIYNSGNIKLHWENKV